MSHYTSVIGCTLSSLVISGMSFHSAWDQMMWNPHSHVHVCICVFPVGWEHFFLHVFLPSTCWSWLVWCIWGAGQFSPVTFPISRCSEPPGYTHYITALCTALHLHKCGIWLHLRLGLRQFYWTIVLRPSVVLNDWKHITLQEMQALTRVVRHNWPRPPR